MRDDDRCGAEKRAGLLGHRSIPPACVSLFVEAAVHQSPEFFAASASSPSAVISSVLPLLAASIIICMMDLPSTSVSARRTLTSDEKVLARSTNDIAGRACRPSLLTTVAMTVFRASGELLSVARVTRQLLTVRLREQSADFLNGRRLPQEPAERLLAQVLEDDLHRLQVFLGPILRAEQENDGVHRLPVQRR